ncbi:Dienelactone hydrolase OS=Streptomyces alboniger OX=132473 GN=CP975_09025 PE=4 SV=1 [Streptomyces alboniger]
MLAAAPYSERGLVYAGFSLGASIAQTLALGDHRARGLLLLHGTSDIAPNASVDDLPVQLHVAEPDAFERTTGSAPGTSRWAASAPTSRCTGTPGPVTSTPTPTCRTTTRRPAEATWRVALGFLDSLQESPGADEPQTGE